MLGQSTIWFESTIRKHRENHFFLRPDELLPNYTNTSPTTSIINCMVQYSTPLAIFGNERHLCSRYYQYEPRDVPDNLKKQEICDKAVRGDPSSL